MPSEKAYDLEQRVNALLASGVDAWHLFSALTYQNNWSNGTLAPAQYRYEAWPLKSVTLTGSLTVPTGFVVGQLIVTLPAAYRPASGHTHTIWARNTSQTGMGAFLQVGSAGSLTWQGATSAGTVAGDIIFFAGSIYLDA